MTLSLLGLALTLLAACAPQVPPDSGFVRSGDPELRALTAELLPDLAARSGLELREPIRVERRSREHLEAYLRAKLDDEVPAEEARWIAESYALLGLLPRDVDLRAVLLDIYTEQVAGFYDPDSTTLFVLDDQPAEVVRPLLVHELVHAVQDQTVDLGGLTHKERGNDRRTAAQAAIEGHATLVMLEFMTEEMQGSPLDLADLPDFASQMRPALAAMAGQFPALRDAPRLLRESLLFPYVEGAGFVQEAWRRGEERSSVLGARLPLSTEQVLSPEHRLSDPPDHPTEVRLPPPDGSRVLYENSLGQLEVGVLLEELLGEGAKASAVGWDGDRFILVEGPQGERGLIWASVWDDTSARDGFLSAMAGALAGSCEEGGWEAMDVDGRPVAVFRAGSVTAERVVPSLIPPS